MVPTARLKAAGDSCIPASPAWTGGLVLLPLPDLKMVKGLALPASIKFRQIIMTGPPGAGKSYLIRMLGGWPEEGYIDLTLKSWWSARSLTLRPREVNLGFPFVGHASALSVFDEEWLNAPEPLQIDESRVLFPPHPRHILSTNWRARYAFFFLVPPPDKILAARLSRASEGAHPVDERVTLGEVERQVNVYRTASLLFHRAAMTTYIIDDFDATPKYLGPSEHHSRTAAAQPG